MVSGNIAYVPACAAIWMRHAPSLPNLSFLCCTLLMTPLINQNFEIACRCRITGQYYINFCFANLVLINSLSVHSCVGCQPLRKLHGIVSLGLASIYPPALDYTRSGFSSPHVLSLNVQAPSSGGKKNKMVETARMAHTCTHIYYD